jgi:hypothetical protein
VAVRANLLVRAAGAVVLLGALLWALLALLGSPEEGGLDGFVEVVTGTLAPEDVARGLTWVDPRRQPLEVTAHGMGKLYDDRNADALVPDARRALAPYLGDDVRALRQSVREEGDVGHIDLQLLTGRGMVEASFRFRRHGDRWLMERARVR